MCLNRPYSFSTYHRKHVKVIFQRTGKDKICQYNSGLNSFDVLTMRVATLYSLVKL